VREGELEGLTYIAFARPDKSRGQLFFRCPSICNRNPGAWPSMAMNSSTLALSSKGIAMVEWSTLGVTS